MAEYVLVKSDSDGDGKQEEIVELPVEDDGTLLLSVVKSQFERATGLKYRSPSSGAWRGIKLADGILFPPSSGWGDHEYVVVVSSKEPERGSVGSSVSELGTEERRESGLAGMKRRAEYDLSSWENDERAQKLADSSIDYDTACDLIVLGLEWSVTDSELLTYFQQYGKITYAEVKKDASGKSRGFGFVRFVDPKLQRQVYEMRHTIRGRRCELKYPRKSPSNLPCKFFVGYLPNHPAVTKDELQTYFSKFGELSDVYIPQPYRGFGFITYNNGFNSQRILSTTHLLRGVQLNVTVAEPKGGSGRAAAVAGAVNPDQPDYSNYGYGTPRGGGGFTTTTYPNQMQYQQSQGAALQYGQQQAYNTAAYSQQYYGSTGYPSQSDYQRHYAGYGQQQQQQQPPPPPPPSTGYGGSNSR